MTGPIGYYSLMDITKTSYNLEVIGGLDITISNKIINVYNIPIVINYGNCDVI